MTINEAMVLIKMVRERLNDIKNIRTQTILRAKTRRGFGDNQIEEESIPEYDVKVADKKVVELQNWLFVADSMIKQSNAKTEINLKTDVEKLLAPLE